MAQCPQTSPLSWSTTRYGYCLRQTTPYNEGGMFLNLHKNLSSKLRDPKKDKEDKRNNSARYYAYIQLLNKQKPTQRVFSGHAHYNDRTRARTAREVSDRLHKAISIYQPAESRPTTAPPGNHALVKKPIYTRPEISAIFDKLESRFHHRSKSRRSSRASQKDVDDKATAKDPEDKDDEQEKKELFMRRFRKRQLYYPADEVSAAIEEYVKDNQSAMASGPRPFSARYYAHSDMEDTLSRDIKSCERKPSQSDVSCTMHRLNQQGDDPGHQERGRRVKSAPPDPERSHRHKKVTEKELDSIIARLTIYDKERWPPESKGHC